jgi:hypothetical protein
VGVGGSGAGLEAARAEGPLDSTTQSRAVDRHARARPVRHEPASGNGDDVREPASNLRALKVAWTARLNLRARRGACADANRSPRARERQR